MKKYIKTRQDSMRSTLSNCACGWKNMINELFLYDTLYKSKKLREINEYLHNFNAIREGDIVEFKTEEDYLLFVLRHGILLDVY